jgi:succinoglycan biosynthesis transport protein ExoP
MSSPAIRNDVAVEPQVPGFTQVQPDTMDLIGIARRNWYLIAAGISVGLVGALIMLSLTPPVYRASARIVIDKTINRYMQSNKVVDEPIFDDASTWSQTHIIASESVILPVVKALDLASDPEFVGAPPADGIVTRMREAYARVKEVAGLSPARASSEPPDLERTAFESAMRQLYVAREDVPNVISIGFESRDPQKAARIANAVADSYLASTVAGKVGSRQFVGKLMQERLAELKTQAADAERTLLEYKMKNQVLGSGDKTRSSEELNRLTAQLAEARVAMAEAKARLDPITSPDDSSLKTAATPDNDLLTKLRTQYLDLGDRATDIERRVGKDHIAATTLRNRMADIRIAIMNEEKRVAQRDYELASARYNELTKTMTQVLGEETSTSPVKARVRELESSAETLRTLYNGMLQRFNESNKADADPNIFSDAHIITRAAVPFQTESSKKRLIVLAVGCLFGLLLGTSAALAREFPFGVFRTPEQVKRATGIFCMILPTIRVSRRSARKVTEYVLDKPFTSFAESLRVVWSMISARKPERGASVVCIVSCAPGEGKTTVATNLACLIASHARVRTLLVDADFHRQTLTAAMAPGARKGLKEALDNPEQLANYVVKKEDSGLDVLPCPVDARLTNAAELLGSIKMKELIRVARSNYDAVIMEVAPIAAVADFRMIAPFCDGFVLVVEWSKTTQRLVIESLSEVAHLWERVLCVALNKADPVALKTVERYKGSRYKAYYQEQQI